MSDAVQIAWTGVIIALIGMIGSIVTVALGVYNSVLANRNTRGLEANTALTRLTANELAVTKSAVVETKAAIVETKTVVEETKAAVKETKENMVTLEQHTNSIKDELVKEVKKAAFARGAKQGAETGQQGPEE